MPENGPMAGKACMVTGANSGIGRVTAEELAGMGATVVMVCRNRSKGERALSEMREKTGGSLELLLANFASLDWSGGWLKNSGRPTIPCRSW